MFVFLDASGQLVEGAITMKWITRSAVWIDRVACPWLIKRFVDSEAEFLFVPKNQVVQIAADTGAIPFDIPGVELGHHNGCCTFEAILSKYDLADPALHRLAQIIRDADVGKDGERDPVAEGLRAIAAGPVCATRMTIEYRAAVRSVRFAVFVVPHGDSPSGA
jgi:hypothetical protein